LYKPSKYVRALETATYRVLGPQPLRHEFEIGVQTPLDLGDEAPAQKAGALSLCACTKQRL